MAAAASPSLAVILPVYKGEPYLAGTLQSVLAQSLRPAEILVVDDGSPDHSAALAQTFAPRVRVLARPNAGISTARNTGLANVSAEWVTFLDQDDLLEPTALERRMDALRREPRADVIYSDRRDLKELGPGRPFRLTPVITTPDPARLPHLLRSRCPFNPGCASIRRSTLQAVGGFDSRFDGVEDWDLWLRLLHHGARFVRVPEPLFQYRVHGASATQNGPRILARSLALLHRHILPHMSLWQRLTSGRRSVSRLRGEAAIVMRFGHTPGALTEMLHSIALDPLHTPHRYTVLAHMLLHPGSLGEPAPAPLQPQPGESEVAPTA